MPSLQPFTPFSNPQTISPHRIEWESNVSKLSPIIALDLAIAEWIAHNVVALDAAEL